jgi:hypothetical protein
LKIGNIDFILPFVSIIGVIIGFLLSTLKDLIQNKPKIKMELKSGQFNYYREYTDDLGQIIIKPTYPQYANFYKVNLQVDIYNYGKGNSAIKSVAANNIANKKHIIGSDVVMKIKSDRNVDYSFNLPATSIVTMNLEWNISKIEDETEELFIDELILPPKEKKRIKFEIEVTNIKNKKYKLIVEPLSIYTAQEFDIPNEVYTED